MAERTPSAPPRLHALVAEDGPFRIEPSRADWKRVWRKEDRIDLYKARLNTIDVELQQKDCGDGDPEFTRGWIESKEEEKHSNPFLNLDRRDRETAGRIYSWRKSVAEHILSLKDETLAGLNHRDAIARHTAGAMLHDYYRFGVCLQCPKWLALSKTKVRADKLLRHIASLAISLGELPPPLIQKWTSNALFDDPLRHLGRPPKDWHRHQKITLAVDILVKLTNSSVASALEIVAEVCREEAIDDTDPEAIDDTDPEAIKTIRDRVRREGKKREADAFM